ncbi:MAG: preprotein translocase subunit Sec61beta [Promethearchaeota archaeon]
MSGTGKKKSARAKRRKSDSPMPQGGAGLIRFYQDAANGIKISPVTALVLAGLLVAVVILARVGIFEWLF